MLYLVYAYGVVLTGWGFLVGNIACSHDSNGNECSLWCILLSDNVGSHWHSYSSSIAMIVEQLSSSRQLVRMAC